jgi:hypothetical protein
MELGRLYDPTHRLRSDHGNSGCVNLLLVALVELAWWAARPHRSQHRQGTLTAAGKCSRT